MASDEVTGFSQVTKEAFFQAVGPRNIHPRSEEGRSVWEDTNRRVVGISTPGYTGRGQRAYYLRDGEASDGA